MSEHDDARFSSFTRDLARRHRRPRSYPPPPRTGDALEQLCAGSAVEAHAPLPRWTFDGIDAEPFEPS